jgi:hypothetical protein
LPKLFHIDDPVKASVAWARYWRLMRWMGMLTVVTVIVAIGVLYSIHGMASIHLYIATAGAIVVALMLTSALMGLVFLSSETGHDESVEDRLSGGVDPDG